MNAQIAAPPVHHYDPHQRLILCGLRGLDHRSTKHARGVTCPACLELLGKEHSASAPRAPEASAPSTLG